MIRRIKKVVEDIEAFMDLRSGITKFGFYLLLSTAILFLTLIFVIAMNIGFVFVLDETIGVRTFFALLESAYINFEIATICIVSITLALSLWVSLLLVHMSISFPVKR